MSDDISIQRLRWLTGCFGIAFMLLAARLVYVQSLAPLKPGGGETSARRVLTPAKRGAIVDVHGQLLAHSRFLYNLRADPVVIGTNALEFAQFTAPLLGMTVEELLPLYTPNPVWREQRYRQSVTNELGQIETVYTPGYYTNRAVRVKEWVEPEDWERIRNITRADFNLAAQEEGRAKWRALRDEAPSTLDRLKMLSEGDIESIQAQRERQRNQVRHNQGLRLQRNEIAVNGLVGDKVERRFYPLGGLAAHVLGHTVESDESVSPGLPPQLLGVLGVERRFDFELQGQAGQKLTRSAKGRELSFLRELEADAQDGLNVRLSLDARIQGIVEEALDEGMVRLSAKALTCVVVRPRTGEIVALANRPTFDPNFYQLYPVDHRMNRALTVPSEPGSTFKMVTYAAALSQGMATMDTLIDCEQGIWSPPSGRAVRDVEGHGLGVIPLELAFAKSSNVAAAKLGLNMDFETFTRYMTNFGFLQRSGIMYRSGADWGGEFGGAIPRRNRMNMELHGRISYGYGIYVTPLQTAMAAAAIANDGLLMKPMVVNALEAPDGRLVRRFDPVPVVQSVQPNVAHQLRQAMRRVVVEGTGRAAALEEYEVAGKTGTSHKVDPATKRQSTEKYISTFVGYFPADNPELCILVLADEPMKRGRGGYYGGAACGPIFQQIARRAASRLAVVPQQPLDPLNPAALWGRAMNWDE
jgi:cell division protein FtsI/penicillin-binding protein 2